MEKIHKEINMKSIPRRILTILCIIGILLSVAVVMDFSFPVSAAEEGLDLCAMQIVVPDDATLVENTAAQELQTYLHKITGIKPDIHTERQHSGAGIYVGATNCAAENSITYPIEGDEKEEAWAIKAIGGNLFLCGAPGRGPLYAVYHLLEDVLGVRWWNMWEEYVPTGDAIVAADYENSGVPAMEYRGAFYGVEAIADYTYFVRNRLNSNLDKIPEEYGGAEEYGYPAHVHTFNRLFSAVDYATHPEWFSLIDGNREMNSQLCLSNQGLRAEYAKRLIQNVAVDPDAIYAVSPDDNTKFCQCNDCQKEIDTLGHSGYVLRFVNEMADAVKNAGYTHTQIEMLVYWVYLEPPKGDLVPAENVLLRFADNYADLLHGLDHPNNADTLEYLKTWMDLSSNDVYFWQYVVVYLENGVFPSMFHYGDDFTMLQEMGVNGWFAEQEQCINVDFWDMKLWLIAKLMENPVSGEEYAALMDEFIYGYYGEEAGKYIREYLYYMHERAEQTDLHQSFGTSIIGAEWLTLQDIVAGNDYFEKAFAAANGDETLLRRLRAVRSGLDRVIHENFGYWKKQAEDEGMSLPFTKREVGKRIYQTMTEQIQLRGAYDPDITQFYSKYDQRYSQQQVDLPEQYENVAREHILDYNAESLRLAYDYTVVTDPQSVMGKAVCCRADSRLAAGSFSLVFPEGRSIPVAAYDPDKLGGSEHYEIGQISAASMLTDSGYQLYSMQWTVPAMSDNAYIYMVSDWGVQNPFMAQELQDWVGQTVEVVISMRVEGNVEGNDPNNYPVYYIDRMFVVPPQTLQDHDYEPYAGRTDADVCKLACTVCGDVTENDHLWDTGEIIKKPTARKAGEIKYTCRDCGITRTDAISKASGSQSSYTILLLAAAVAVNIAALALLAVVLLKKQKKD